MSEFVKELMLNQKFLGTLFPRIPTMIERNWRDRIKNLQDNTNEKKEIKRKIQPDLQEKEEKRPKLTIEEKKEELIIEPQVEKGKDDTKEKFSMNPIKEVKSDEKKKQDMKDIRNKYLGNFQKEIDDFEDD